MHLFCEVLTKITVAFPGRERYFINNTSLLNPGYEVHFNLLICLFTLIVLVTCTSLYQGKMSFLHAQISSSKTYKK